MTQNFENHAKFVPGFHVGVLGIFAINLIWSIYRLIRAFSGESVIALLLAIAFILLAFYSRIFALTVQDRVIRLEMALRMQQLFPAEFRPRIPEFSVNQLVALRFASDAELLVLAKKVLDEKLNDRKAIKKMIRDWQPDFLRA
jgi:dolichyl-phosphate-mannose--protein O-mannosyl transferase